LTKPVELIATLDDSAKSAEIKELLAEIAELSDKVTFKEDNTLAVRKPSFLITNPGSDQGPRFAGSPLGHEFTSLVLTKPVELIATLDDSAKSAEIKELLAEIAELSD
ncbi:alkyl hydroperoxide reductase subunit F, partial [Klebsiella pneumoniae]